MLTEQLETDHILDTANVDELFKIIGENSYLTKFKDDVNRIFMNTVVNTRKKMFMELYAKTSRKQLSQLEIDEFCDRCEIDFQIEKQQLKRK